MGSFTLPFENERFAILNAIHWVSLFFVRTVLHYFKTLDISSDMFSIFVLLKSLFYLTVNFGR